MRQRAGRPARAVEASSVRRHPVAQGRTTRRGSPPRRAPARPLVYILAQRPFFTHAVADTLRRTSRAGSASVRSITLSPCCPSMLDNHDRAPRSGQFDVHTWLHARTHARTGGGHTHAAMVTVSAKTRAPADITQMWRRTTTGGRTCKRATEHRHCTSSARDSGLVEALPALRRDLCQS